MTPPVTAPGRILKYFQADTTLQALASGGIRIAYAEFPPCYPSVTLQIRGTAEPRCGYYENLVADHNASCDVNVWVKKADNSGSGRGDNALVMAIDERLRVIWFKIGLVIPEVRDIQRLGAPVIVPDPDMQVLHSSSTYSFVYATIDQ
jgi:hypothetical protein